MHTRQASQCGPQQQRFQLLRYLHGNEDCFRLYRKLPGGSLTHWETPPLHGARQLLPYTDDQRRATMQRLEPDHAAAFETVREQWMEGVDADAELSEDFQGQIAAPPQVSRENRLALHLLAFWLQGDGT